MSRAKSDSLYSPVLRWKRGEKKALEELAPEIREHVVPIIELVRRPIELQLRRRKRSDVLNRLVGELEEARGSIPFYLDLRHVKGLLDEPGRPHPMEIIGVQAAARALTVIPVVGIRADKNLSEAASRVFTSCGAGLCVRVAPPEWTREDSARQLSSLLTNLGLDPENVDLVLDHGSPDPAFDYSAVHPHAVKAIPWRRIVTLSGAFPKDLSSLPKNGQYCIPRRDWELWNTRFSRPSDRARTVYGDYTIQHAYFEEPPAHANFSASIRYTATSYWVVMRGEGVRNEDGPGYDQWPANAQLLVERPEFCGAAFSRGDEYIASMAAQHDKTGSAETWISAGINHHLTFVVNQLKGRVA
jgi:Beta protein